MKNFWLRYNLWISIISYAAGVILVVFFAIIPLVRKLESTSGEIQKRTIDGQVISSRISQLPQLREQRVSIEEKAGELDVILSNDNSVDFIKTLESLADQTHNKIELQVLTSSTGSNTAAKKRVAKKNEGSVDIKDSLPSDNYLDIQINLEGDYQSFLNFLNKLENLNQYVNVVSLDIKRSEPEQSQVISNQPFSNNGDNQGEASSSSNTSEIKPTLKSSLEAIVYLK